MDSAAPFSPLYGFSLFASYGLSWTLYFVSRGARERERKRERERAEREAEKEGERAHRRKCVTSRGRSDLKKTLEKKKLGQFVVCCNVNCLNFNYLP